MAFDLSDNVIDSEEQVRGDERAYEGARKASNRRRCSVPCHSIAPSHSTDISYTVFYGRTTGYLTVTVIPAAR